MWAFLGCSVVGFLVLIGRRIFVKGELGGTSAGRYGSAFIMVVLWIVYVVIAGAGFLGYIGGEDEYITPTATEKFD